MDQEFLPTTLHVKGSETTKSHYYLAQASQKAAIFVGGIGGDFDSPAKNLYPKLATELAGGGISGLRVQFRYPTILEEAVQDMLAGARCLEGMGVECLGLVGHSFGGAVVIQAATHLKFAKTVVTLATQGYGAEAIAKLPPGVSVLLIHGSNDETLSPMNSVFAYDLAFGKKKLEILSGNSHGLVESSEEVFTLVHDWLVKELNC